MTDPAITPSMAEETVKLIQASKAFSYASTAGLTIICFDWLLNLGSEINLVWNAEGMTMKVVYLFVRYVPIAYSIAVPFYTIGRYTASECKVSYNFIGTLYLIVQLCADLVLTIRTWAVWAKGKYITYVLFGLYTMTVLLAVGLYAASLLYTHNFTFPKPVYGCYPKFDSAYLPAALVVHTIFSTVILILMLIRGVSLYWWGKSSALFQAIYSDGISFYIYSAALSIANVTLLFGKSKDSILLILLVGSINPVLACRVVLHIRRKYAELKDNMLPANKGGRMGTTYGQRSVIE